MICVVVSNQCGPPKPMQTAESPEKLLEMLQDALSQFDYDPPFTIQRLCELKPDAFRLTGHPGTPKAISNLRQNGAVIGEAAVGHYHCA
eukprot:scaffold273701_cov33-Prasinocladus_malaysianus.AAC.1